MSSEHLKLKHMDPREAAVYEVRSAQAGNTAFGTAFAVARDEHGTYLLTCAHVVGLLGGEPVIGTLPAREIANGHAQGIDLALLAVDGLRDAPLLDRWIEGEEGEAVATRGYSRIDAKRPEIERLSVLA